MRRLAPVFAALLAVALLGGCPGGRPGLPPRHIVLLTFDGLRADHLYCYTNTRRTSSLPTDELARMNDRAFALDEISAGGVTFANAFAPSALTLPSLATLFTGLQPVATGVLDERSRLPLDVPTLAELARASGFHTAAFVSHPELDVLSAVGRGFETAHWCRSDADALAFARDWLDRDFGDERQVLLWIHLSGLEPPWRPIPAGELPRREMQPGRFVDPGYKGPVDGSPAFFARLASGKPPLEPADSAALTELYDGRVAAVLGQMASFLYGAFDFNRRGAEVTEFWARSLVVVTATHGFDLGECGGRIHAEPRDGMLHVPLVLRHPDSLTGARVLEPVVELADVLPTLVELFELPRPRVMAGRSLLGLTDSRPAQPFEERPAILHSAERVLAARDARWRLVWIPYRSRLPADDPRRELPIVALYDCSGGRPGNESQVELRPDVVARLQQEVRQWIKAQTFRNGLRLVPGRKPEDPPRAELRAGNAGSSPR